MPPSHGNKTTPHQQVYMAAEANSSEATLVNNPGGGGYSVRDDGVAQALSSNVTDKPKMTWKRATEEEKARRNWEARMVTKLRCIM